MPVPIPTLPFGDLELNFDLMSGLAVVIVTTFLMGILAGKQEHDAAVKTNPDGSVVITDPSRRNITIFDWIEDGAYGVIGGLVAMWMGTGVGIPIPVAVIAGGLAGRKLVLPLVEKITVATKS